MRGPFRPNELEFRATPVTGNAERLLMLRPWATNHIKIVFVHAVV